MVHGLEKSLSPRKTNFLSLFHQQWSRFSHEEISKYGGVSQKVTIILDFPMKKPTIFLWIFPCSHGFSMEFPPDFVQERDSSGATPLWLAAKGTKCPASELQMLQSHSKDFIGDSHCTKINVENPMRNP